MEDHPRIRGTNAYLKKDLLIAAGSPPHTRDKLGTDDSGVYEFGITPAYAGQISAPLMSDIIPGDHPRIRGTNIGIQWCRKVLLGSPPHTRDKFFQDIVQRNMGRITPAYAGQM